MPNTTSLKGANQDKLVRFFLRLQANVKTYHWSTHSYARHVASDQLYNKLDSLVDRFIEVYMGKYGRPHVQAPEKQYKITITKMTDPEMFLYLQEISKYMRKNAELFGTNAHADLKNIMDEIQSVLSQTLYLFKTT